MLHRAKDLSPEQRHAAEILLGYPVSEDEAVSIKRLDSAVVTPSRLSPKERVEALEQLEERLAGAEIDAEEENAAVDEAMNAVRPNYRRLD
jgi:hypothetical protein